MFRCVLVCAAALSLAASGAQAAPLPAALRAHAVRRTTPIAIDGHLDEAVWQTAPRQTGFTQHFPTDNVPASFETSFSVLYDDEAVYVGVWCKDPEPAKIRALLTRRDIDALSDEVILGFDSYHDRRTGWGFQLNAAGVQRDFILFDDSNQDDTWDAVWTGNSTITAEGWTAEFRIPLNQLRYDSAETKIWGFQIVRLIARTAEQDTWSPWPRSSPGVVSRFGVLDGIDHLVPARRLELLPYVTGGLERQPVDVGDPLNKQYAPRFGAGADLKYGLGPAFTLSATINPDFGQVEADPSQITLGPFELFYPEKRPFFVEGTDLFRLPFGHNDGSIETAFYSRRIGGAPSLGNLDPVYIDAPKSTTIYTAAKLTGKTPSGWSVGILDAVTGPEDAPLIDAIGVKHDPLVAPLTNYAVARVKRDLRDGATQLGASLSAVDRAIDDPELAATLHDQAYTAGVQILNRWGHDAWQLRFNAVESYVHGAPGAIAATQEDPNHYFQRPGATDEHYDPTRTSLTGTGMDWRIGRDGDVKHWRFGMTGELRSPGLELNDLGFQQGSDRLLNVLYLNYREDTPGTHLLNWYCNTDIYELTTLEPRLTDAGFDVNAGAMFENYWNLGGGFTYDNNRWDVISMRGGPALRSDGNVNAYAYVNTDSRKWIWFSVNGNFNAIPAQDEITGGVSVGATIQARSNVDLFVGPGWSEVDNPLQYVGQANDGGGRTHYLFAHIQQSTVNMTMRLNWTFSPHLSLQAYAQPFVATGRYDAYKDVNHSGAARFQDRFTSITGNAYNEDDSNVYVNTGGAAYTVARPDFDLRQLRSTIVLRWEYRPGSSLFAIWSHGQTNTLIDGRFDLGRDISGLASDPSDDVVMVKLNYWLGL